jgi:hypothetical protein
LKIELINVYIKFKLSEFKSVKLSFYNCNSDSSSYLRYFMLYLAFIIPFEIFASFPPNILLVIGFR